MPVKHCSNRSCSRALRAASFGIFLLAADTAHAAASNTFLSLAGVPGSSADARHQNESEVLTFTQVIGANKCPELVIHKVLDAATPVLAHLGVRGRMIPKGKLEIVRPDTGAPVLRAEMLDIGVGTTELVQSANGSVTEKVPLYPRMVTLTFHAQGRDGRPLQPIAAQLGADCRRAGFGGASQ